MSDKIIIEDGTDPNHQTDHCDHCGHVFEGNENDGGEERISTFTVSEYVTLCRKCYNAAGNNVR